MVDKIMVTTRALNAALWGGDVTRLLPRDDRTHEQDGAGWYRYAGLRAPVRRLTGDELVQVTIENGRYLMNVQDQEGGWIAARFPADGRELEAEIANDS